MQSIGYSYTDSVRLRSLQNPCLSNFSIYMKHTPNVDSTIRLLEYSVDGKVILNPSPFHQTDLPRLFEGPTQTVGRILLIENLRPDVISCLGENLDVDAIFFAEHITTEFRGIEKAPPPPSLAFCPSQIVERGHVNIHYQQVIDLGNTGYHKNLEYDLYAEHNVPRKIRRLPHLSGRQLALSRACCSVLVKRRGETWYSE